MLAVIVPEPGGEVSAAEVGEYAPRYLRFASELPKTPSEKVRKVELRDAGVTAGTHDRGPAPRRRRR